MTERWRCFVAIELDDALRAALADAIATWRAHPQTEGLRWVDPRALHLTLAFLGEVDADRIPAVAESLRDVAADHATTALATGRLGAFARPGSARVLWYGVADPDGRLSTLAADIDAALAIGSPDPFRPHVTLARARRRAVDLRGWIEDASASAPDGRLEVAAIHLKQSHLSSGPAQYETLASLELGVGAGV